MISQAPRSAIHLPFARIRILHTKKESLHGAVSSHLQSDVSLAHSFSPFRPSLRCLLPSKVPALGRVDTVVLDKTGVITETEMHFVGAEPFLGRPTSKSVMSYIVSSRSHLFAGRCLFCLEILAPSLRRSHKLRYGGALHIRKTEEFRPMAIQNFSAISRSPQPKVSQWLGTLKDRLSKIRV